MEVVPKLRVAGAARALDHVIYSLTTYVESVIWWKMTIHPDTCATAVTTKANHQERTLWTQVMMSLLRVRRPVLMMTGVEDLRRKMMNGMAVLQSRNPSTR